MPRVQTPAQLLLPTLEASLFRTTVDDLKWYVAALQTSIPTRKGDLVAMLTRALSDPASLKQLLARLTPVQQQVLAEVAHRLAGKYDADLLEAKYPGSQAPRLSRNYCPRSSAAARPIWASVLTIHTTTTAVKAMAANTGM